MAQGSLRGPLTRPGIEWEVFTKPSFDSEIVARQYTSHQVRQQLNDFGWIQSMSALGYCYDNAACESFFASLKSECFPQNGVFESLQQARWPCSITSRLVITNGAGVRRERAAAKIGSS